MSEKDQLSKKLKKPGSSDAGRAQSKMRSSVSSSMSSQQSGLKRAASLSEEAAAQLDSLDSELRSLADKVSFSTHHAAMSDLDSGIGELQQQVEGLRTRGYRYRNYLENKVGVLGNKWRTARSALHREIEQSEAELKPMYDQLAGKVSRTTTSSQISTLEREVEQLKARLDSNENAIEAIYSNIQQTYYQTQSQIKEVVWLLDQVDQASFDLLVGEDPVQAVKAKWWRDGKKKGPEGILYLTNQRLLFEQKEQIATKKVLFVATEKETLQELLFEVSVAAIESVQASSKGLMGHEDHLDFDFGSGAEYANAHFHIDGQDSKFWAGLVKRVKNGDIERERIVLEGESTQAREDSLAEAPTQCEACGAPIETLITKGQRQIQCEYCGTTMRW